MTSKKLTYYLNYAKQHFSAHSGILTILFMIVPILVVPYLLAISSRDILYLTFPTAAAVGIMFMYILPISIALQLNSYLFSKKQVDFVVSLPLSRRSLFWINYILGVLFMFAMIIIMTLIIYIVCALHPLLVVSGAVLGRIIINLFVGYLFVYSASYLCMMSTGHQLTAILLSVVMMFLLSYINYDIKYDDNYDSPTTGNGVVIADTEVMYDTNSAIKNMMITATPTYVTIDGGRINAVQLLVTLSETAIYTGLAYVVFKRRKLEVAETSYLTESSHYIAKGIILFIPLCFIARMLENMQYIDFFIVFTVISIYIISYLYDLATARARANLLKSIWSFVAICGIVGVYYFGVHFIARPIARGDWTGQRLFSEKDVKSVSVSVPSKFSPFLDDITITDKEFISLFFDKSLVLYDEYNEKYGYGEKIVTFETSKGTFKYHFGDNFDLAENVISYIIENTSFVDYSTINKFPFSVDDIVKVYSRRDIDLDTATKILNILNTEQINEQTIMQYYFDYYECPIDGSVSVGYCQLRDYLDPSVLPIHFEEYVDGELNVYSSSGAISDEAYVGILNIINKFDMDTVIKQMAEAQHQYLDINVSIVDDALHEYFLGKAWQEDVNSQATKQLKKDFADWILKWEGKELKVTDFKKIVIIHISYGNYDYKSSKSATLVLPVDDELIELIGKYRLDEYTEDYYGDDADYVYD